MSTVAATALIIFAKAPVAGESKTRLIPLLGEEGAVQAHEELVRRVLAEVSPLASDTSEFMACLWGASAHPTLGAWADEYGLSSQLQANGDLGQRMAHALESSLGAGAEQAILIGSDCPEMNAAYIRDAKTALAEADLVLGPAEDGGYVLIGINNTPALAEAYKALFTDVDWGSNRVLQQTVAKANVAGLTVALLDPRWDVDRPADWQRYLHLKNSTATGRLR
jgi:rSAM/selenodomain-associated transferase 1